MIWKGMLKQKLGAHIAPSSFNVLCMGSTNWIHKILSCDLQYNKK